MNIVILSAALAPVAASGAVVEGSIYLRAVEDLLFFVELKGVGTLAEIRPLHVAARVEALTRSHVSATVKQRLAAIRALLDWMTVGKAIPSNPVASWVVSTHPPCARSLLSATFTFVAFGNDRFSVGFRNCIQSV